MKDSLGSRATGSLAFWIDRLREARFEVLLDEVAVRERGCPFPRAGIQGASFGRIIYLSTEATPETAIHEYAHRWLQGLYHSDKAAWEALSAEVRDSEWYWVGKRCAYWKSEERVLEESLAYAVGRLSSESLSGTIHKERDRLVEIALRVVDDLLRGIYPEGGEPYWMEQLIGTLGAETGDRSQGVTMLQDALSMAGRWERLGKSPEEIRKATGWVRWFDGEWRYECQDGTLSLEGERYLSKLKRDYPPLADKVASTSIREHIRPLPVPRHPLPFFFPDETLYRCYPALRDLTVCPIQGFRRRFLKAGYSDSERTLYMDVTLGKAEMIRCFHHELQHAIQSSEGWSMGLDWDTAQELYSESRRIVQEMRYCWAGWVARYGIPRWEQPLDEEMRYIFNGYLMELTDMERVLPFTKQRWIIDRWARLREREKAECLTVIDHFREEWNRHIRIDTLQFSSGEELFLRSTGEIEARVVAARCGLNPAIRRSLPLRDSMEPSLRNGPLLLTRRVGEVEQVSVLTDWMDAE